MADQEPPISSLVSKLAESWHDPVLRHWRWQRLRGRVKPEAGPRTRPGDAVAEGADLYIAGLAAKDEDRVARGLRLLLNGVESGVGASGATLEGSTARQAQLAGATSKAWLAARRAGRPEQWRLASVARAIIGAYDALQLAGGLPEIGERPDGVENLAPFASIGAADRGAFDELRRQSRLYDLETLRRDGWLRLDKGLWSGLWHCPPGGWPAHEGLAHHDLGAAEIHWNGLPLLVDPGAGLSEAVSHGGLTLDRRNPYPENRAGYSEAFRREIAGPAPELRTHLDGVKLCMDGFGRFGGHRQIERVWRFEDGALRIEDLILGTGRPLIERRLVTSWMVDRDDQGAVLSHGEHRLRLAVEGAISLQAVNDVTQIVIAARANLPWTGVLTLRPVSG